MNNTQSNQNSDKKLYRIILFVIIGLAAFSSAVKELRQGHAFIAEVAQTFASWSDVVPTASARTPVKVVTLKTHVDNVVMQRQSGDFRWNGPLAPGQSIEIKGIIGDIRAEAGTGNEVHVVATKTSRRSDIDSVQIKVVQHTGGVTICALYPSESGEFGDCESGSGRSRNNSSTSGQKNNDVRVDFTVQVPSRVGFIGKTINGDVSATALSGNVVTKTINGSIKISTTGYAEASTINGEISARVGDGNWTGPLEFKTLNGEINLDLPANVSTDVDAETLNGQINSDFLINVTTFKERKRVQGRIGVGGRELHLKTLNGSINLRIAS
jgi:hypothetical protein